MQFNEDIHTKDYLLNNVEVLVDLAKTSKDFALSSIATDISILKIQDITEGQGATIAHMLAKFHPEWVTTSSSQNIIVLQISDDYGWSVAHHLAEHQSSWVQTEAARNTLMMSIIDDYGWSVAHALAKFQKDWLKTASSEDHSILLMQDDDGVSVAHLLAEFQPKWLESEACKNQQILQFQDHSGNSVASTLVVHQPDWIHSEEAKNPIILKTIALTLALRHPDALEHEGIFHKDILTLETNEKILAEYIVEKYEQSHGIKTQDIAMKLITQGAAYKHSEFMDSSIGLDILKQASALIDDSLSPLVAYKHAQALYATCFYATEHAKKKDSEACPAVLWQNILKEAEGIIQNLHKKHPELGDAEFHVDLLCEPANQYIRHHQASENFKGLNIEDLIESEPAIGNKLC
jgi:hypothetical protein